MVDHAPRSALGLALTGSERGDPGNTPLEDDERDGLLPGHILTRAELNQWEALNIAQVQDWLVHRRRSEVLDVPFLQQLHRRMFGDTWKWAGTFRRSDKNVSPYPWTAVPQLMLDLVDNIAEQHERSARTPEALDDLAMRFHHQMVHIHPWPNGNGRHARLATDLLLRQWQRPPFSWGGSDLKAVGGARSAYISALRAADAGDFTLLRAFARS